MAERALFDVGPEDILRDVKKAAFYLEAIVNANKDYFTSTDIPACYRAAEYRLQVALGWVQLFRRCQASPDGTAPFFKPEDVERAFRDDIEPLPIDKGAI